MALGFLNCIDPQTHDLTIILACNGDCIKVYCRNVPFGNDSMSQLSHLNNFDNAVLCLSVRNKLGVIVICNINSNIKDYRKQCNSNIIEIFGEKE